MLEFIQAIESAGISPPEAITIDGALKRFSGNGDRGDLSAYYCLHDHGDFQAGFFGDWRSGYYQTWTSRAESELTPEQRLEYRKKINEAKATDEAERAQRAAWAASRAAERWNKAEPASTDNAYLGKKHIKAYDAREDSNGLLIPVQDITGKIHSLQSIDTEGNKKFHPGGAIRGHFHQIEGAGDILYICEGFATGATIREITGNAVIIAFNAGNLKPVAEAIAKAYPNKKIVICADNDRKTAGNPGLMKGREAAAAIGAGLVCPEFGEHEQGSDFNDLYVLRGADAVKEALKPKPSMGMTPAQTRVSGRLHAKPSEPEYLLTYNDKPFLKRGIVGAILAMGGLGKSFLMACIAFFAAGGYPWAGIRPAHPLNILILFAEDDSETVDHRLWSIGNGFFPEGLHAASIVGLCGPLLTMSNGNLIESDHYLWLRETIRNHAGLDLLMLDPKSRFFAGEENSNDHNTRFIQCLEKLTHEFPGLTILFSHHVNKAAIKDGSSQTMARGGSALIDGVRFAIGLSEMTKEEATKYEIQNPEQYFSLEVVKSNYGIKPEKQYFQKDQETGLPGPVDPEQGLILDQIQFLHDLLSNADTEYSARDLDRENAGKPIFDAMRERFQTFQRKRIPYLIHIGKKRGHFSEYEVGTDKKGRRKTIIKPICGFTE